MPRTMFGNLRLAGQTVVVVAILVALRAVLWELGVEGMSPTAVSAGIITAGIFVVGTVDNVLRPILISGRVELNGLLVLISVVGGIGAFGLLGIVLGPVLIAVAVAVLEAERERRAGVPPPPDPAASA